MSDFSELFEMYDKVGYGRFGDVYKAKYKPTGEIFAVKVIQRRKLSIAYITNEIRLGSLIRHHNIVKIMFTLYNDRYFFIVMEFLDGITLEDFINSGKFNENEARVYVLEIAKALYFLHSHSIVYRDLKPNNIMICKSGVKIVDLGTLSLINNCDNSSRFASCVDHLSECKQADAERTTVLDNSGTSKYTEKSEDKSLADINIKQLTRKRCGTILYTSPESLSQSPCITDKVDVWSLGCLVYKMITGTELYSGNSYEEIKKAIIEKPVILREHELSDDLKKLLLMMLQKQHKKRCDIVDVMKSPWLCTHTSVRTLVDSCVLCHGSLSNLENEICSFKLCKYCENRKTKMKEIFSKKYYLHGPSNCADDDECIQRKLTHWGLDVHHDMKYYTSLSKLFKFHCGSIEQIGTAKHVRQAILEADLSKKVMTYYNKPRCCFPFRDMYLYIVRKTIYSDSDKRQIKSVLDASILRSFLHEMLCKSLNYKIVIERQLFFKIIITEDRSCRRIILFRNSCKYKDFQWMYLFIDKALKKFAKMVNDNDILLI